MLHTVRTGLSFALAVSLTGLISPALGKDEVSLNGLLPTDQEYFRGLYLEQRGQIREAVGAFERAVEKRGPRMEAYVRKSLAELGKIYMGRGPMHNTRRGLEVLTQAALQADSLMELLRQR